MITFLKRFVATVYLREKRLTDKYSFSTWHRVQFELLYFFNGIVLSFIFFICGIINYKVSVNIILVVGFVSLSIMWSLSAEEKDSKTFQRIERLSQEVEPLPLIVVPVLLFMTLITFILSMGFCYDALY